MAKERQLSTPVTRRPSAGPWTRCLVVQLVDALEAGLVQQLSARRSEGREVCARHFGKLALGLNRHDRRHRPSGRELPKGQLLAVGESLEYCGVPVTHL